MPKSHASTDKTASPERNPRDFQKALLDWFAVSKRDLPWRREPSAYKTVVSEFMLQQTQVKTVLPYFTRWLEWFPDFRALAAAPEELVLKAWEGLGYYSRARNLHRLAKAVAALPQPPSSAAAWLEMPGVGPYTSAAIASISAGEAIACVDGNVVRILARLTSDTREFRDSASAAKEFTPLATQLLSEQHPGDYNQAMMELGATLCTKAKPACALCPVRAHCRSRDREDAANLPKFAPKNYEERTIERLWCLKGNLILVEQHASDSRRLANLCELPGAAALPELEAALASQKPHLIKRRAITRFRITERIHRVSPANLTNLPKDWKWVPVQEIAGLSFSGPHRKWLSELLAEETD